MKSSFTHNENICLVCCNQINAATNLQNHEPSEGDLSICAYCGNITQYDNELRIQPLSEIELEILFEQYPLLKEQVIQIQMLFVGSLKYNQDN